MRVRTVTAVWLASLALFIAAVPAAQAEPPENPGPPEVSLRVEESPEGAPAGVVTREPYASKPLHSGSRITGAGGIRSCSSTPAACNSEVGVEFCNNLSRMWMTGGASPRRYRCPPPLRSATASTTRQGHAGDPDTAWRTVTVGSITSTSCDTASGTAYSPVLSKPCA
ncbi:hypothetical protein NX801_29935 [Streptomyces sp. LP05-1]|uniref:Secreted protein n=1 Tax=Streptomyces pyxinae TaxID=2970734 RepID=A0ABT2CT85_9ACTN|nr:hypothetical protein [Streptomyces sp. LP05-1]MCS0639784.1 hypothetical protein [Streptomyces sp. LP05-1]